MKLNSRLIKVTASAVVAIVIAAGGYLLGQSRADHASPSTEPSASAAPGLIAKLEREPYDDKPSAGDEDLMERQFAVRALPIDPLSDDEVQALIARYHRSVTDHLGTEAEKNFADYQKEIDGLKKDGWRFGWVTVWDYGSIDGEEIIVKGGNHIVTTGVGMFRRNALAAANHGRLVKLGAPEKIPVLMKPGESITVEIVKPGSVSALSTIGIQSGDTKILLPTNAAELTAKAFAARDIAVPNNWIVVNVR